MRCHGLGALSCSDFVEGNRIVQLKCCARRVLHVQRVWDAAQQVLARQGALYIQRHCLQRLWWYHGALLAVVWRFFFIAARKSGKFCRHDMRGSGWHFLTALPRLCHGFTVCIETLHFHLLATCSTLSSAPGGVQIRRWQRSRTVRPVHAYAPRFSSAARPSILRCVLPRCHSGSMRSSRCRAMLWL